MRIALKAFSSATIISFFLFLFPSFLTPKVYALSVVPINTEIKLPAASSYMPLSKGQQRYIKEVKVRVETKVTQPAVIITPPPPQISSTTSSQIVPASTQNKDLLESLDEENSITTLDTLSEQADMVRTKGDTQVSSYLPVQTPIPIHDSVAIEAQEPLVSVSPAVSEVQLNGDVLFDMVNQYRTNLGLPAFEKEEKLCVLAQERANEAYNEIWVTYSMHSGLRNRNLQYSVWENLISQNSESAALIWWQNSYIHNQGLKSDMKYSCCKCNGKACSLLISDYTSK